MFFFKINHLFFLGASVFKFYSITIYEGKNHRSLFKTPLYLFRFKRARLLLKRFYFSYNYCFAVLVLYAWFKIKGGSFSNNKISNSKKTTEDEIQSADDVYQNNNEPRFSEIALLSEHSNQFYNLCVQYHVFNFTPAK